MSTLVRQATRCRFLIAECRLVREDEITFSFSPRFSVEFKGGTELLIQRELHFIQKCSPPWVVLKIA